MTIKFLCLVVPSNKIIPLHDADAIETAEKKGSYLLQELVCYLNF